MNKELGDFIYGIAEFNSCVFCKKFGFNKNCPVKNFYKDDGNPSPLKIEEGQNMCKSYVLKALESAFIQ